MYNVSSSDGLFALVLFNNDLIFDDDPQASKAFIMLTALIEQVLLLCVLTWLWLLCAFGLLT